MIHKLFNFIRERERNLSSAKIEMELAMAQPNEFEELRNKMELESQMRAHNHRLRVLNEALKPNHNVILFLVNSGQISNEEYGKYLLDETGRYLPKLKNNDNTNNNNLPSNISSDT